MSYSPIENEIDSTHFDEGSARNSYSNQITLFSHKENGDPNIEVLDLPMPSPACSDCQSVDGSLSASLIDSGNINEYDNLKGVKSYGWDEPSTTIALDLCKKYILNPYNAFLKLIGWRSFRSQYDIIPWYKRICNIVYPLFIFAMLLFATSSQIISCFSRARSRPPESVGNYSILFCDDHLITSDITIYLLILASYLGGLFIFRFSETEHLSSLSETVFLSYNYTSINKSRKRPVFILSVFLTCGVLWFIGSFATSILRIFALRLNTSTTIIHWFTTNVTAVNQEDYLIINFSIYNALHFLFVSSSMLGFAFFDLLYIAVVINYASQCQLLIFYIENIKDKVISKHYKTLTDATKEIYHVSEFLKVLNGKLAFVMTLVLLVFIDNIVSSYSDLSKTSYQVESIAVGFLNLFQWMTATIFPIIMASILTAKCRGLRSLGLQIASRPFVYSEEPALELQMFLNYTSSTKYSAKLALVPMYPALVASGAFILLLLVTLNILIPNIASVRWF